ncbi:MAG: hypothetical protein PHW74_11630 [Desulfobacca sp.]|nr:hypothetical protein [Desulfobacca sp.]
MPPETLTATLIYLLGQRDVQLLDRVGNQLHPFKSTEMARICQYLQMQHWDWQSALNAIEIEPHVSLSDLQAKESLTLSFPLLERLLRQLRENYPGLNLVRIIFINTNRQKKGSKFAPKEPYLFHELITSKISILSQAVGFVDAPVITSLVIDESPINLDWAFNFADGWFQQSWPALDSGPESDIFLNHGPGIPSLGRALASLAGVYYPDRVVIFDQVEHEGPRLSVVPLFEEAFKDRHGLLLHLENLDLPSAFQICRNSAFYIRYRSLYLLLALASEALGGDLETARDLKQKLLRDESACPNALNITSSEWEDLLNTVLHSMAATQIARAVIRLLNSLRRQDFLSAGLFVIVAVESAVRLLLQKAWPGCLDREDLLDAAKIPRSVATDIFKRLTPRRDGYYTPNFRIYTRAMGLLKKAKIFGDHAQFLATILNNPHFDALRQGRNKFAHAGQAFRRRLLASVLFPDLALDEAAARLDAKFELTGSSFESLIHLESDLTGFTFHDWTVSISHQAKRLVELRSITRHWQTG